MKVQVELQALRNKCNNPISDTFVGLGGRGTYPLLGKSL